MASRHRIAALLVGLAGAATAQAQAPSSENAGRWTLQDGLDAPPWLQVSGLVRARYEALDNPFVAGRSGRDDILGLQTLLRAQIDAGPVAVVGELLDSRRLSGRRNGGAPAEIDTLEPVQLNLVWSIDNAMAPGADLDLTAGRFTMDLGSRRLIARANFRSIMQSYDGARAVWAQPDGWRVTAFAMSPTRRAPSDAPSALDNEVVLNPTADNIRLQGLHFEAPFPAKIRGEVYGLALDERDAADALTRNRDLLTLGVRLRRAPAAGSSDFDLEYAHQTGSVRATTAPTDTIDLDHEATMLHLEAGYTWDAPWAPRLSVHYDLATGDRSPADLTNERFDPLFGDRSFEFGPTGLWGAIARTNLSSPAIRLEVRPDEASDALIMLRQVDLDARRDSFANSGVRDAAGASGRNVGQQVEVRYRRWLAPQALRLSLGGAALMRGEFLETAPNAASEGDPVYGYVELAWSF